MLFTPDGHEERIGCLQNFTFWSSDVQRSYEELSARGVAFRGPPEKAEWGSAAIFSDLDGNQFVLSSK